jgi:hypothetical protein
MLDVIAALSVATATTKVEGTGQLIEDAKLLYNFYNQAKSETVDFQKLVHSNELASLIDAIARTAHVASALMKDPDQSKNIASLLNSIK